MSEISASNFVVAYVKKQAGFKKRVAHKNIIMTRDERWKVNLFTAHPRYLPFGFIPPDRVAKICDKFCDRLNPKFQTYANWKWHTESTTNIFQLIAFL